jgi:hypothetical protein
MSDEVDLETCKMRRMKSNFAGREPSPPAAAAEARKEGGGNLIEEEAKSGGRERGRGSEK